MWEKRGKEVLFSDVLLEFKKALSFSNWFLVFFFFFLIFGFSRFSLCWLLFAVSRRRRKCFPSWLGFLNWYFEQTGEGGKTFYQCLWCGLAEHHTDFVMSCGCAEGSIPSHFSVWCDWWPHWSMSILGTESSLNATLCFVGWTRTTLSQW